MYVIGIALLALTILAALSRRTRGLEDELPDAVAAAWAHDGRCIRKTLR